MHIFLSFIAIFSSGDPYSGYHSHAAYRLQKSPVKLRFGGRQSKKSRWNYFESLQDSKATRQEIENFTSLREGKSCLNSEPDHAKRKGHFLIKISLHVQICYVHASLILKIITCSNLKIFDSKMRYPLNDALSFR